MKSLEIGILDFGYRRNYENSISIIPDLLKEAKLIERLGFNRSWYGEHFDASVEMPWLSPEIILPLICGNTTQIKVGIAGTLISYASPIKIASNFKLLSNLFSDRIDLGFAKGAASKSYEQYFNVELIDHRTAEAKHRKKEVIQSIITLLRDEVNLKDNRVIIPPFLGCIPEMWNLIGSPEGYIDSLEMRLNCSRALFLNNINYEPGISELNSYKTEFMQKMGFKPKINIAIAGSCQTNIAIAEKIKNETSVSLKFLNQDNLVIGNPTFLKHSLTEIAKRYQINEIIFLELGSNANDRKTSFRLISKLFELPNKIDHQ